MESTVSHHPAPAAPDPPPRDGSLAARYRALLAGGDLAWVASCRDLRVIGQGGQGVVFRARKAGADGFAVPVALKAFSPETYRTPTAYEEDMGRVAAVAARVAAVRHDNLVAVHDFTAHAGVRVMEMEWVDGYDLRHLLTPATLARSRDRLAPDHWAYVNDVVLTDGPRQPRFKPGVAIQVFRDALAALAALHRAGVTHGDLKPANVMVKRATGAAKVVDVGSAVDVRLAGGRRVWSPAYAAPEVLDGEPATPRADLASLGYVLVEMLAGQAPFDGVTGLADLREAKRTLERRLPKLLPAEVAGNDLLVGLCRKLVAADPGRRFADAQSADLGRKGAAAFHRQLVKGDLASEYGNDLRVWLEQLGDAAPAGG
jgi:serine/threonine-protein kinase